MAKLQIDESESGGMLRLAPGDVAELTLPETRTAGYRWQQVSAGSPVYSLKDEGFARATGAGGTGVHRWAITALKTGSAPLEFAYGRSWVTAAGKRFTMTITVA